MRIFFIEPKVIAAYFRYEDDTIREWCKAGKYGNCKEGGRWKIPVTTVRKVHPEVPIETWMEIIEDIYNQDRDKKQAQKALQQSVNKANADSHRQVNPI